MDYAIPASHNPKMVFALLRKAALTCGPYADKGGCYKQVYLLDGWVLKRTTLAQVWCELYPQFYMPVARVVIEPYRAWMLGEKSGPHQMGWMVQRKLAQDTEASDSHNDLRYRKYLYYHAMRGRDVGFECYHRNVGMTKRGEMRVIDFGCGEWETDDYLRRFIKVEGDMIVRHGWEGLCDPVARAEPWIPGDGVRSMDHLEDTD